MDFGYSVSFHILFHISACTSYMLIVFCWLDILFGFTFVIAAVFFLLSALFQLLRKTILMISPPVYCAC